MFTKSDLEELNDFHPAAKRIAEGIVKEANNP